MANYKKAIFAGGCFWCMVEPFEMQDGIEKVVSGYTGGHKADPTYEEVARGNTGHTEAVEITYDPNKVSYSDLVEIYWQQTDPTDASGQFADRGDSYRPVIFYGDENEKKIAEESRKELDESNRFTQPVVTAIEPRSKFYEAEDYHQNFYKDKPNYYQRYAEGSGRKPFLRQYWSN